MNNFKISKDDDSKNIKMNSSNINAPNIRVVSDDLKESVPNINNDFMKPRLNERDVDSEKPVKTNFRMMEDDLMAFGNAKKMKNFKSSSEEEEDDDEEDYDDDEDYDDEEEIDDEIQNTNETLGSMDDDEEEETEEVGGNSYNEETQDTEETASTTSKRMPPKRHKTPEELEQEKQEFIYRLERLEKNGYKPAKRFTMASNYEDVKFEYERLKKQRDVDNSIKFQRKVLMAVITGVEFLNGKFDPLSIKLDGWSESIYENLHEYDEVFEELHEKYKEKGKMPPELRLLMMVAGSGFMFHLTNSLFKSKMPGLNDILQQNPDLMNNVKQAAMNSMRNNMDGEEKQAFDFMTSAVPQGPKREMKGPSGVDDILSRINKKEDTSSSVSSNQSVKKKIKIKKSQHVINLE